LRKNIRPINNEKELMEALYNINNLWDAIPGTEEYEVLEDLFNFVLAYEEKLF
jgi:type III secretion system FlhB-like substrate exporter